MGNFHTQTLKSLIAIFSSSIKPVCAWKSSHGWHIKPKRPRRQHKTSSYLAAFFGHQFSISWLYDARRRWQIYINILIVSFFRDTKIAKALLPAFTTRISSNWFWIRLVQSTFLSAVNAMQLFVSSHKSNWLDWCLFKWNHRTMSAEIQIPICETEIVA